jgi:hypothetical protein
MAGLARAKWTFSQPRAKMVIQELDESESIKMAAIKA